MSVLTYSAWINLHPEYVVYFWPQKNNKLDGVFPPALPKAMHMYLELGQVNSWEGQLN